VLPPLSQPQPQPQPQRAALALDSMACAIGPQQDEELLELEEELPLEADEPLLPDPPDGLELLPDPLKPLDIWLLPRRLPKRMFGTRAERIRGFYHRQNSKQSATPAHPHDCFNGYSDCGIKPLTIAMIDNSRSKITSGRSMLHGFITLAEKNTLRVVKAEVQCASSPL
jgi:hypothetical protein